MPLVAAMVLGTLTDTVGQRLVVFLFRKLAQVLEPRLEFFFCHSVLIVLPTFEMGLPGCRIKSGCENPSRHPADRHFWVMDEGVYRVIVNTQERSRQNRSRLVAVGSGTGPGQ